MLYMLRNRNFVQEMLKQAWDAGTRTLVFTVDLAVPGLRLCDFRNGINGGSVRGGIDVVRAVALEARGVLMGRPWLYALTVRGEAGVRNPLRVFEREITIALSLTGISSVEELNRDAIDQIG